MSRTPQLFTLPLEVITALKERSKQTGEPMSRLAEQGIRVVLAMPAPEPQEGSNDPELPTTRSEKLVLQALKQAGPGWHLPAKLGQMAGLTGRMAEKSLRALAMRGEAHRWGDGDQCYDGRFISAWGLEPPLPIIRRLIDDCAGDRYKLVGKVLPLIQKLAQGMDDVEQVRKWVSEATRLSYEELEIENVRERCS